MQKTILKQAKSQINLKNIEKYFNIESQIGQDLDRCLSTTDESHSPSDDFISKDQDEELLIELAKNQTKLNDYSLNGSSIGYSSRAVLFSWVEKVISNLGLKESNQLAIYFRFTTLYDRINEQMFIEEKSITSDKELKKLLVTIFLIVYKFEGHSIGKITIPCLINAFLKNAKVNQQRMVNEVRSMELSILKSIGYNVYMLNSNIHSISLVILTLIRSHYCLSEALFQLIETALPRMNKHLLLSSGTLFTSFPIDNAVISLLATFDYIQRGLENEIEFKRADAFSHHVLIKEALQLSDDLYYYLKEELKVIKLSKKEFSFFAEKFSKD